MANRRLQNREIERKKRQNKNTIKAISIVAGVIIFLVIGWIVWDVNDRRIVITFNDTRIPTSEFQFFLDMIGRTPEARAAALTEFIGTLVMLEKANEFNITMDPEDRDMLMEWIVDSRAAAIAAGERNPFRGLTNERLFDIYSVQWMMIQPLIAEAVFPDYVLGLDEDELRQEFYQALEDEFISEYDMHVLFIAHFDLDYLDEILPAAQAVGSSDEFIALIHEHCMWQSEFEEIPPISIDALYYDFDFDEETIAMLLALEEGSVSQVVRATDQTSIIVYVVSKEILNKEELFENFRANTLEELRFETFFQQAPIWIEEARQRMEINDRAVDRA